MLVLSGYSDLMIYTLWIIQVLSHVLESSVLLSDNEAVWGWCERRERRMMKMKSLLAEKLDLSGSLDQHTMLRLLHNKKTLWSEELKKCRDMETKCFSPGLVWRSLVFFLWSIVSQFRLVFCNMSLSELSVCVRRQQTSASVFEQLSFLLMWFIDRCFCESLDSTDDSFTCVNSENHSWGSSCSSVPHFPTVLCFSHLCETLPTEPVLKYDWSLETFDILWRD